MHRWLCFGINNASILYSSCFNDFDMHFFCFCASLEAEVPVNVNSLLYFGLFLFVPQQATHRRSNTASVSSNGSARSAQPLQESHCDPVSSHPPQFAAVEYYRISMHNCLYIVVFSKYAYALRSTHLQTKYVLEVRTSTLAHFTSNCTTSNRQSNSMSNLPSFPHSLPSVFEAKE